MVGGKGEEGYVCRYGGCGERMFVLDNNNKYFLSVFICFKSAAINWDVRVRGNI